MNKMSINNVMISPTLAKIKTIGDKEHYINSQMIVALSPAESEGNTDMLLLNGNTYTLKGTPAHYAEQYRMENKSGGVLLNMAV